MKKQEVFVLFETDSHKTKSSRVFLGVFSSFGEAWDAFIKDVMDEERNLSKKERCEMLGINVDEVEEFTGIDIETNEDIYEDENIGADYNNSWCQIIEASLGVLEEN
jgi:hypothetical protein